ncbi:MAG: hypothetical protein ACYC6Y_28085, partial [Thermoguttaceae bacterium]
RLWINSIAWLLREPRLADPGAYQTWHRPRVVLYEPSDAPRFGSCDDGDFYHLFCLLSRHYWTFADDRLDDPADLRIVADGRREFSAAEIATLSDYVRGGGKLLILPHIPLETDPDGKQGSLLSDVLDLSRTERTSGDEATVHTLPGGGQVVLLSDELVPQCSRIAPATRVPNAQESTREKAILAVIRQALGK